MKTLVLTWSINTSLFITIALHAVLTRAQAVSNSTAMNDTATQTASSVDEPAISEKLLNCFSKFLISVLKEDEFKLLSNGSVYVPMYEKAYNYSDFLHDNETNAVAVCKEFSEEFLKCQTKHVELDPGEYMKLDNGSIHIPGYKKVFDTRNHHLDENTQIVIICLPSVTGDVDEKDEEDDITLSIVSYIGLSISILALVFHLIAFLLVPEIRNLPGYCLASMSIALLVAYLCFVCIPAAASNVLTCPRLAVVMYYFFLSSFFWMSTIAFDVFRTLRLATTRLRISGNKLPWKRFLIYSLYSWLVPLAIVLTAVLIDKYANIPASYKSGFSKSKMCWFAGGNAHFLYFALPIIFIMAVNVALLTASGITIHKASMKSSGQDNRAVLKQRFFMFLKLAVIMGLGWVFGIIAAYANTVVLWYIFVIINTLQGLFIFLGFSLTGKVRSNLSVRFTMKKVSATLSNQTVSQMSTVSGIV